MKIHNFPIWLINLERSKDRLEFQEAQFKNHGLQFTRVDAVDGRKDISEHIKGIKLSPQWNTMSNGQRGCGLSHVSILKKMVAENIPAVFVMEDDVVLCENFADEFEKYFQDDDLKYDIIYVGNQHDKVSTKHTRLNRPTFCTHALIYTLQGAKNILNHINQVGLYVYDIVIIQADTKRQLKTISYIKKPSDDEIKKHNLHVPRSVGLCYQTQQFESVIHG
jgi:GR25 family glycosyltransferase involved in LPS biosynthesis